MAAQGTDVLFTVSLIAAIFMKFSVFGSNSGMCPYWFGYHSHFCGFEGSKFTVYVDASSHYPFL